MSIVFSKIKLLIFIFYAKPQKPRKYVIFVHKSGVKIYHKFIIS